MQAVHLHISTMMADSLQQGCDLLPTDAASKHVGEVATTHLRDASSASSWPVCSAVSHPAKLVGPLRPKLGVASMPTSTAVGHSACMAKRAYVNFTLPAWHKGLMPISP